MTHGDVGNREPCHGAAQDPSVHGEPALVGRYILSVWHALSHAEESVDQSPATDAKRGKTEGVAEPCSGMGQQCERVCGQSRKLLYSIPAALCDEIAQAATAERMSVAEHG